MNLKKHIQFNILLFIIVFSLTPTHGQSIENKGNAITLFQSKQFEKALPLFTNLLNQYPTDTILCYYTGVCKVETNRFSDETKKLLLTALQSNVPNNVQYFIGKNYHALNYFDLALVYYNQYKKIANKKELKEFELKEKISMCNSCINPFTNFYSALGKDKNRDAVSSQEFAPKSNKETGEIIYNSSETTEKIDSTAPKVDIFENMPAFIDSSINFNLTSELYYSKIHQFKTKEGEHFFIEGWKNSEELKRLISETDSLREEYSKLSFSVNRGKISARVVELENLIIDKKSTTDFSYMKARESELNYWNKASDQEKWKLIEENDSIRLDSERKALIEVEEEKKAFIQTTEAIVTDTIAQDSLTIDSTKIYTEPIATEPVTQGKIVFKVQIGAYNTELPESAKKLYKKISVLRRIDQVVDERNYTIYTIGELTNIKDALKLQDQIRQESVKDAFVIAIKDGKRIPLNEALELIKQ